jgi:hypothetical protein
MVAAFDLFRLIDFHDIVTSRIGGSSGGTTPTVTPANYLQAWICAE